MPPMLILFDVYTYRTVTWSNSRNNPFDYSIKDRADMTSNMNDADILKLIQPIALKSKLVWTAIVNVGPRQDLGLGPLGHRYMVPITGGKLYAGPNLEGLSGVILPGGADRQILRSDGIKELDALYEMQADNGDVITVHNKVIVDESRIEGDTNMERYAMSVLKVSAPKGSHDWLNRRLFVGTLQSARPNRQAVIVRAWEMDVFS